MARSYQYPTQFLRTSTFSKSVGTSATLLVGDDRSRCAVEAYNDDASATVYVSSDPNVTTATGRPVPAGQAMFDQLGRGPLYAIAASGTIDVRVTCWIEPPTA